MAETVATWGGLEIQLVSDEVLGVIDGARSFLNLINEALSISLGISNIAKTFVTSNLNLTRALLNEFVGQLRNLLQDLFNLGLFANFTDIKLIERQGLAAIKGGYPAYERRMLAQLNNRNDPKRPDYTASSTVLGLFFYIGDNLILRAEEGGSFVDGLLDTSRIAPLRQLVRAFAALFGISLGSNATLPVAVNVRAEYATPSAVSSGNAELALSSFLGRSRYRIVWNSATAPTGNTQDPEPNIPASAFIVEVSCYPNGFSAAWIAPDTASTGRNGSQSFTTGPYQAGNSGQPLVIFGGEDAITLDPSVQWPFAPGGNLPPGSHPLYFYRDARTPEVIRKAFGKSGNEYYNQKRFFVTKEEAIRQGILEGTYSITLSEQDLPFYCPIVNGEIDISRKEVPRAIYVRVIPVSQRVTETNFRAARWKPRAWTRNEDTLVELDPIQSVRGEDPLTVNDLGTPSAIVEITIPSGQQNLYVRAIQTAIAITTLSRSDLTEPSLVTGARTPVVDPTYRETGLESIATEINQRMRIQNPEQYYGLRSSTQSPQAFVADLYERIVAKADEYLRAQGELPQSVLQALEPMFDALVNWKWSDTDVSVASDNPALRYTILQSLQSSNVNTPLSRNRNSTRLYFSSRNGTPDSVLRPLEVKWREGGFGVAYHRSSLDSSPVIGPSSGRDVQYWFARDLITDELYEMAREVLSLTSDSSSTQRGEGGWEAVRVSAPRTVTGTAASVLNKVESFFNTVLAGTQNVADGVLRVIEFLEQRVREIQEFIRRIQSYLDVPLQFSFPSAKVLVLITNGTNGLVTGLLSAREKPQEGPNGYAAGGILVAGSAPSILVDLLAKGLTPATNP